MGFKEDIYSLVFEHNYGTWPIYRRFTYQKYSNMVIFHSEVFNFPEGMVGCWFFLVGHWSCSTNPSIINTLRTWTCKIKLGSFPDFPIPGPRVPRGCPVGFGSPWVRRLPTTNSKLSRRVAPYCPTALREFRRGSVLSLAELLMGGKKAWVPRLLAEKY